MNWGVFLNVLTVMAFVMSLTSWIHTFINQRKRLSISVVACDKFDTRLVFLFFFENKSRLPISITRIKLCNNGKSVENEPVERLLFENTKTLGKEITDHHSLYSERFPISLGMLDSCSAYVVFADCQRVFEMIPTLLNFQVYTNRGKELQMTLCKPGRSVLKMWDKNSFVICHDVPPLQHLVTGLVYPHNLGIVNTFIQIWGWFCGRFNKVFM